MALQAHATGRLVLVVEPGAEAPLGLRDVPHIEWNGEDDAPIERAVDDVARQQALAAPPRRKQRVAWIKALLGLTLLIIAIVAAYSLMPLGPIGGSATSAGPEIDRRLAAAVQAAVVEIEASGEQILDTTIAQQSADSPADPITLNARDGTVRVMALCVDCGPIVLNVDQGERSSFTRPRMLTSGVSRAVVTFRATGDAPLLARVICDDGFPCDFAVILATATRSLASPRPSPSPGPGRGGSRPERTPTERRLDELQSAVNNTSVEVRQLGGDVASIKGDVATIRGDIAGVSERLDFTDNDIAYQRGLVQLALIGLAALIVLQFVLIALVIFRRNSPRQKQHEAAPTPPQEDAASSGPLVFASYARRDQERVDQVVRDIEAAGVDLWLDRENIGGGTVWAGEIVRAIRNARGMVLFCSPSAFESDHVLREVSLAAAYGKPLLPIALAPATAPDGFAYYLSTRQIIDLASDPDWREKVLAALRATAVTSET